MNNRDKKCIITKNINGCKKYHISIKEKQDFYEMCTLITSLTRAPLAKKYKKQHNVRINSMV